MVISDDESSSSDESDDHDGDCAGITAKIDNTDKKRQSSKVQRSATSVKSTDLCKKLRMFQVLTALTRFIHLNSHYYYALPFPHSVGTISATNNWLRFWNFCASILGTLGRLVSNCLVVSVKRMRA